MRCTQAVVFLHVMHHDGGQTGGRMQEVWAWRKNVPADWHGA